jgi:hypothetical protein
LKFTVNFCVSVFVFISGVKEGNVEFGTNTRSDGIPSVSRRWCSNFGQYNELGVIQVLLEYMRTFLKKLYDIGC